MKEINHYGIVYKITCSINLKVYIGVTTKLLNERIRGHKYNSKKVKDLYTKL